MKWLYYLGFFFLGCLVTYLLSWIYIRKVLRLKGKTFRKEDKRALFHWSLKPYPMLWFSRQQTDLIKEKTRTLDLELREERFRYKKLFETHQQISAELEETTSINRELNHLLKGTDSPDVRQFRQNNHSAGAKKQTRPYGSPKMTQLYFTIPEMDGSFSVEKGTANPDDRKHYRVVCEEKKDTGELHFISGPYDLKAIENIDYYMIPVCEVLNIAERSNANKVIQEKAGTVVKISGSWVTDKKIKVKLV